MQRDYPVLHFATIVITSSEIGSVETAAAVGEERLGGEAVRLIDLATPGPGDRRGVFDMAGSNSKPAKLAERLKRMAGRHYGAAHRDWIAWLRRQDEEEIRDRIEALTNVFVSKLRGGASLEGRQRRLAVKFGLIYAALRLAEEARIIDWTPKRIRKGVRLSFERAIGLAARTDDELISQLRQVLNDDTLSIPKRRIGSETEPDHWVAVSGVVRRGAGVIGLSIAGLKRHFGADAERLVRLLEGRGVLTRSRGKKRWQFERNQRRVDLHALDLAFLNNADD